MNFSFLVQGFNMKIILQYEDGPNQVLDYNPNSSSLATRHPDTDERYIHAKMPEELKEDVPYIYRLKASAHHDYIGNDDLFEFI